MFSIAVPSIIQPSVPYITEIHSEKVHMNIKYLIYKITKIIYTYLNILCYCQRVAEFVGYVVKKVKL